MQAQKEAPPDMQCRDKFLLQSAIASSGTSTRDVTSEMVVICLFNLFYLTQFKTECPFLTYSFFMVYSQS